MITHIELTEFANHTQNDITVCECDTNALKVYRKFGGAIFFGTLTSTDKNNFKTIEAHYWNVVKSDTADNGFQTIDIANYLTNNTYVYTDHRGVERSIAYMEGLVSEREINRKYIKGDRLTSTGSVAVLKQ